MAKINEKGVLIFYDWLDRLKEAQLEPEDALSVIYALADYSRYGEDPVTKFQGPLQYAVGLMFDQIKRAEIKSGVLKENATSRWNKSKAMQSDANAMQSDANAMQSNAEQCTAMQSNTTNTNTNTDTNTDTKNNNNNNNNNTFIQDAQAREEIDEIQLYSRISKLFDVHDVDGEVDDFITYNNARGWKGIGGEYILASETTLERYVIRWGRGENVRYGRKEG